LLRRALRCRWKISFEREQERGQQGLIVLLDGVEDPHNLGAVIRTALALAHTAL